MKLAVVIIHYNTSADLDRCLESLAAYPPAAEHQVVVVDNASDDAGLAAVRERYGQCLWIMNAENTGYARGANRGMAAVEADYYLVLNPDIVVQPGALDRLLAFADQHPRAGLVGPQLLNEDGSIQDSCRRFYTFRTLLLRRTILGRIFPNSETVRRHLMHDFDHRSARPVDWVLGGCILVRREAVDRCGAMDERFFLYFEDVDWCYRMWQAGYEVMYTPDARFVHRHRRESAGKKFGRSWWLHLGSLLSFYEKWGMVVWLLKKWRDPLLVFLLWALDMAALTGAFVGAYLLRGAMGGMFSEPLYPFAEYRPLLVFALLLASLTFLLSGRYRAGRGRRRPPAEHLQQVGVVAVLLLAATYLGHLDVVSRAVLLMFIPLLALATAGAEELLGRLRDRLAAGRFSLERTLLAGPPERIDAWLREAGNAARLGIDPAGYVADPGRAGALPPLAGGALPWLGPASGMIETVQRYRISQVVFWPGADGSESGGPAAWERLAALRRLRVRLRWQGDGVWLLAAGARAEVFGGQLSAVQATGGGAAARAVAGRLLSAAAGGVLWLVGLLPWLWLKAVRAPRGSAAVVTTPVSDLWGHDPELKVAVDADGRVLPLPWQWRLAGPLITGGLALAGPRPLTGGRRDVPRGPQQELEFWRSEPRAPGLVGNWSAGAAEGGRWGRWAALVRQGWRDPGGFGSLAGDPGRNEQHEES